jgi:hypothetical protein
VTDDFWGGPIFSYTRKQAIADGVLVDVTEMAREAGFKYPVVVTSRIWHECVVPDDASRQLGQSEQGRLWDVLVVLHFAIRKGAEGSEVQFKVSFLCREGEQREITLKSICGPDDDGRPCITIMAPDED